MTKFIRTGMAAYMGIADAVASERRLEVLTEAYLNATAPRAYAYTGGRAIYTHKPVEVTYKRFVKRAARYARIAFSYKLG